MAITERKIFSVTDINKHVKEIIEYSFDGYTMVEGEISQLQKSQLGHIYITLKDEKSSVRCTLWSSRVEKMEVTPKIGLKAIIKCKVSFYDKTGSYQLDILGITSSSIGKFHALFEKLKLKLKDEGLFDVKFKKPLPEYPKNISVITSLTGSVLQDILKILERRAPGINIEVYGCNVQGDNCSKSIINQLISINKKNTSDIVIIARGGGSLEDLIGYNDEFLARQIYNSKIPVITAIGHETDTTISDLVSDIRAATPSEAAEIATKKSVDDLLNNIDEYKKALSNSICRIIDNFKSALRELKNIIDKNNPSTKIYNYHQTIDIFHETLKTKLLSNLISKRNKINSLKIKLKGSNPVNKVDKLESILINKKEHLKSLITNILNQKRNILKLRENTIKDISPLNILEKGYSLVYSDNKLSNKTSSFKIDEEIKIRVIDGEILSKVNKIKRN